MKHTLKITLILLFFFFMSQLVGLGVINAYIDHKTLAETGEVNFISLPYNMERPPLEPKSSFVFIFTAIVIGTILMLLLIRFKKIFMWKIWFFLAVFLCLSIALSPFMNEYIALFLSMILAGYKIFRPNIIIHNLTEIFIYGGLAAVFVPLLNIFTAIVILILISVYDFIAVFKLKHMITLAKFQTKTNIFAGLFIPYDEKKFKISFKKSFKEELKGKASGKTKLAILGGGDIGFSLLFAGVVMKDLMLNNIMLIGFLKALIIPLCTSAMLFLLFVKGKKDKFYPAMPFLTIGCLIGYFIILLCGR